MAVMLIAMRKLAKIQTNLMGVKVGVKDGSESCVLNSTCTLPLDVCALIAYMLYCQQMIEDIWNEDVDQPVGYFELYFQSMASTCLLMKGRNKQQMLAKLQRLMAGASVSQENLFDLQNINPFMTLQKSPLFQDLIKFQKHLLPFSYTHSVMFMPPIQAILWVQYLLIVCAAEELTEEANQLLEQEVQTFLHLMKKVRDRGDDTQLVPKMLYCVTVFHCIRQFYCTFC